MLFVGRTLSAMSARTPVGAMSGMKTEAGIWLEKGLQELEDSWREGDGQQKSGSWLEESWRADDGQQKSGSWLEDSCREDDDQQKSAGSDGFIAGTRIPKPKMPKPKMTRARSVGGGGDSGNTCAASDLPAIIRPAVALLRF